MPALTTLTVNDGQDTPGEHDFVPRGKQNGVFLFRESDGVPIGDNLLSVSSSHGNRHKVSVRLKLPQTASQDVGGLATEVVTRTAYCRVDFDFAGDSTPEERADAQAFVSNLLKADQTEITSVVSDLSDFY